MIQIEDWEMRYRNDDGYTAPELLVMVLIGTVFGHPKHKDGEKVRTTRIVKIEKNIVETRSGSIYRLGKPNKKYIKWCEENGKIENIAKILDWEN